MFGLNLELQGGLIVRGSLINVKVAQIKKKILVVLIFDTFCCPDLTIQLGKRDEKLKKKEMRLDEERSEREALEKERDTLKKDLASLKSLTNQQKQLIAKKDKQIQEHSEELESEKAKLAAIFNMAGARK